MYTAYRNASEVVESRGFDLFAGAPHVALLASRDNDRLAPCLGRSLCRRWHGLCAARQRLAVRLTWPALVVLALLMSCSRVRARSRHAMTGVVPEPLNTAMFGRSRPPVADVAVTAILAVDETYLETIPESMTERMVAVSQISAGQARSALGWLSSPDVMLAAEPRVHGHIELPRTHAEGRPSVSSRLASTLCSALLTVSRWLVVLA